MSLIQTLDYRAYALGGATAEKRFVEQFRQSAQKTGFMALANHTIPLQLIAHQRELAKKFFALADEVKRKYHRPDVGGQVGFTPLGVEKAQGAHEPDVKEFWQNGDTFGNIDVSEVPGFKEACDELFYEFNKLYRAMMQVVALSLGLPKEYFDREIGNSIVRSIHYPAQENPFQGDLDIIPGGNYGAMCSWEHTDINDLTLLLVTSKGLELFFEKVWQQVLCEATTILVNIGDMLQHLTGGRYRSCVHRVRCERNIARYSTPFFGHRIDAASVAPLAHLGESNLATYPYKTEGEYLMVRLREIGLIK